MPEQLGNSGVCKEITEYLRTHGRKVLWLHWVTEHTREIELTALAVVRIPRWLWKEQTKTA